ncbi:hypothetical protein [Streptomyces sp. NPDC048442]
MVTTTPATVRDQPGSLVEALRAKLARGGARDALPAVRVTPLTPR